MPKEIKKLFQVLHLFLLAQSVLDAVLNTADLLQLKLLQQLSPHLDGKLVWDAEIGLQFNLISRHLYTRSLHLFHMLVRILCRPVQLANHLRLWRLITLPCATSKKTGLLQNILSSELRSPEMMSCWIMLNLFIEMTSRCCAIGEQRIRSTITHSGLYFTQCNSAQAPRRRIVDNQL